MRWWFGLVLVGAACAAVTLDYGVATDWSGVPTTPLDGPALATIWAACAADPVCAAQFTQTGFTAQFAVFSAGAPQTVEGAAQAALAGRTLEDIQTWLWVERLKINVLTISPCASCENYREGECVTEQDVTLNNCASYYASTTTLLVLLAVFEVALIAYGAGQLWLLFKRQAARSKLPDWDEQKR